VIDADFDGWISIQDLRRFLIDILKMEEKEIQEYKLERLHKIMDSSKTG
jgi:Ca2+-binding EF-hand superfamily protein